MKTMGNIIDLFRHSDHDDFTALLAPHMEQLYRLAYRFSGSRHEAEDLVQDLLLRLYPRRQKLAKIDKLSPWLARVLYNLFIDGVRKSTRNPLATADGDVELELMSDSREQPEAVSENTQLQQRLQQALLHLNPDQRALVSLHDMEGYTLSELATLLDTPIGTLKSRLHRARKQLRSELEMEPLAGSHRDNHKRASL